MRLNLILALLSILNIDAAPGKPFVLRIRRLDGSIEKVGFASEEEASELTLQDALETLQGEGEGNTQTNKQCSVQFGSSCIPISTKKGKDSDSPTLQEIGIQHGSLLTLVPGDSAVNKGKPKGLQQKKSSSNANKKEDAWIPFPDLAKNYKNTLRQIQRRKNSAQLSFGDLSAMHQALHVVEPQPKGPLERLYLCQVAAERFFQSSSSKEDGTQPRVALLLGTLHRERQDVKKIRHKTSLSSTTEAEEFCQVAKVQALWEPPQTTVDGYYDASQLLLPFTSNKQLMNVAKWLGLVPVGWMYSYPDQRHNKEEDIKRNKKKNGDGDDGDDGALPVFGADVQVGALLQMANMKALGREQGNRFVTVAMHAPTGATEVFQLSDVAVQMVAEDMFILNDPDSQDNGGTDSKKKKKKKKRSNLPNRHVTTKHAVLVDGRETTNVDSVLCLVNTALLQHRGKFVGSDSNGVKKSNPYQLTKKTRKALAKALESNEQPALFELLCNFNVLVALYDEFQQEAEIQALVETVYKWSRGLKKSTMLDTMLVKRLRQLFAIS